MKEISVKSLRLYVFSFLYTCFRSLLINTRLVSISYFVSVPLRKGHRGLEYQCSFVRLYLFLFAFLIICIEVFDFRRLFFAFLIICIETFGFRGLFCNITSVLCEDWSPAWYSGLLDLGGAAKEKNIFTKVEVCNFR